MALAVYSYAESPMKSPAVSLAVYGAYLVTNGVALLLAPSLALGLLGLPPVEEPWVRVVGLVAGEIGFYFLVAARNDIPAFYPATVYGRGFAALAFAALVALKIGPLQLLIFGAVDLVTSVWTYLAIKRERQA
jgi:hypothetical protein